MNLNETVKQLEVKLSKLIELLANPSQTVGEVQFFSLQLEEDFFQIRQGLDLTSTGKFPYYRPTICYTFFSKMN
jgi:hypothetical protein